MVVAEKKPARKNTSIWLGFFDQEGELLKEKEIKEKRGSLMGRDLIKTREGEGYLLVTSLEDPKKETNPHTVIYRLNKDGRAVSERAYMPGLENGILGLDYAPGAGYTASGYT